MLDKVISVAPMMDWTDRHCRFLHRLISKQALLYTEMITAPAILHGDRARLLGFDAAEHPVAIQLGGSVPAELAQATTIAKDYGYKEVNLNVGCPSDRVQNGAFGAVLMKSPDLVADCVSAMMDAAGDLLVTVKCRIGVDDQIPVEILPLFIEKIRAAGITHISIHARKAWLDGLSPKQNRDIPPLNYPLVYKMKSQFPGMNIAINGGITSLSEADTHFSNGMDGVMVGRKAYHDPMSVLAGADRYLTGQGDDVLETEVIDAMLPYIAAHIERGGRLNQITRHMLGLFTGQPGARGWRRVLSEKSHIPGAGVREVLEAYGMVKRNQEAA
jgi:tRNA-dihydrouridine synthase A